MSELIDKQAVTDALCGMRLSDDRSDDEKGAFQLALTLAVGVLRDLPSAQPERTRGKWTIEDCHAATYKYCCSNCKAHHRARYDFCPSCGADMRNDQDA